MEHGTEWVGESWDELKYIRQVGCGQLHALPLLGNKRPEAHVAHRTPQR